MATPTILTLAMVGFLLFSTIMLSAADETCNVDGGSLMTQCGSYVSSDGPKTAPSPACCDVVKKTDISCACSSLFGVLPVNISMDKVCYIASYCNNPLPVGGMCGAYKVPQKC